MNLVVNAREVMPTGGRLEIVWRGVTFRMSRDGALLAQQPQELGSQRCPLLPRAREGLEVVGLGKRLG